MSRITDNDAIQAAKVLKDYCGSIQYCTDCIFYKCHPLLSCNYDTPADWVIPDFIPEESQDSKRLREREEFFEGTYEERAQRRKDEAQERYLAEWKARREA